MSRRDTQHAVVPRLRFPEFRDAPDWDPQSIEQICEILNNRRVPITSSARVPGPYPYYGASGIVDYVDDYIFDERLVLVGEDGAKWKAFEPTAFIADGKYWVNNHAHVLKPIGLIDTLLADYLTLLDIGGYVTGAAPPKLTLQKLKTIPIPVPTSDDEQRKIADCLGSLDNLIAAEGQKLEALRVHKNGLMQQLFPRENETQPRLRFPEFRDASDWNSFRLDTLEADFRIELGRGKVISHDDMRANPGPHPVYSSSVIDNGLMGTYGDYLFDEELISWSVDGGGHFFYRPKHKFSVTNVSGYMRVLSDDIVCAFLAYQLQRLHASETFNYVQKAHPSVIRTLYTVGLPEPSEQQSIAECLLSLDTRVAAQAEKLDVLRAHKRGLMQQLFPAAGDLAGGEV